MTNQALFHEIVEAHSSAVLAVCASVLGPGPDAEDAWQETFVSALRAYPFDGVANVEAWLVRVAGRRCIDVLRGRRREQPVDDADLLGVLGRDHAPGADELALPDEVWEHVVTLTPRQRFVIVHRYVAGWSFGEIAAELDCSPAAARRCGSDAVAALRARLVPSDTPTEESR